MRPAEGQAAGAADPAIRLSGVSMVFGAKGGPVTALDRIDLAIGRNRFVSIVGRSGCGKSTLLRIICGLLRPTAGSVSVSGATPETSLRDRRFGFVFQDATLLSWRTALENVALPMKLRRAPSATQRRQRALELLRLVRLDGFADHYPSQLSGGMRQRVAIARALSCDPDILLMDEPFGALDEFTRQEMNVELVRLWQERNRTIVFVTHNLGEALFLSDVVVVMGSSPGQVRAILDVDLPRPRGPKVRADPRFISRLGEIEEILRHG